MKPKFLLALEPLLIALSVLAPVSAFSHANLIQNGTLRPRDNAAPQANKTPAGVTPTYNQATMDANPGETCGVNPGTGVLVARTATQPVTNLRAGQTLTVNWQETINHTGWYQIWFTPNANDTGWVRLIDQITDNAGGSYSQAVTIPTTNCSSCALRLIQVMIDNHPNVPTYYYSCANITITPDGQPPAAGGSTGSSGSSASGSSTPDCP